MAINAFQQGEQFFETQRTRDLANTAAERREVGINALGDQFGEAALAPAEFAAVTGAAGREDTRLDVKERAAAADVRRTIENQRADRDDEQTQKLGAARKMVGFITKGLENGGDLNDILTRVKPAMLQLGVTEEEIGSMPQAFRDNPNLFKEMGGAIAAMDKGVTGRRAIGRPIEVVRNGKRLFIQTFSDGSIEERDLGQSVQSISAEDRAANAAARTDVLEAKIDPEREEELKRRQARGTTVGKAEGVIIAGDLPPGERETAQGTINLEQRQLKDDFMQSTIDTALDQTNGWTAGIFSGIRFIGGTPQANLSSTLATIQANIGFEELQRMRDASKTGGALGQVSERENELLQAVWGSVQQSQSAEQLKRNLNLLKDTLRASRQRIADAWEVDYGTVYGGEGSQIPSIVGEDPETERLLQKYDLGGPV